MHSFVLKITCGWRVERALKNRTILSRKYTKKSFSPKKADLTALREINLEFTHFFRLPKNTQRSWRRREEERCVTSKLSRMSISVFLCLFCAYVLFVFRQAESNSVWLDISHGKQASRNENKIFGVFVFWLVTRKLLRFNIKTNCEFNYTFFGGCACIRGFHKL